MGMCTSYRYRKKGENNKQCEPGEEAPKENGVKKDAATNQDKQNHLYSVHVVPPSESKIPQKKREDEDKDTIQYKEERVSIKNGQKEGDQNISNSNKFKSSPESHLNKEGASKISQTNLYPSMEYRPINIKKHNFEEYQQNSEGHQESCGQSSFPASHKEKTIGNYSFLNNPQRLAHSRAVIQKKQFSNKSLAYKSHLYNGTESSLHSIHGGNSSFREATSHKQPQKVPSQKEVSHAYSNFSTFKKSNVKANKDENITKCRKEESLGDHADICTLQAVNPGSIHNTLPFNSHKHEHIAQTLGCQISSQQQNNQHRIQQFQVKSMH